MADPKMKIIRILSPGHDVSKFALTLGSEVLAMYEISEMDLIAAKKHDQAGIWMPMLSLFSEKSGMEFWKMVEVFKKTIDTDPLDKWGPRQRPPWTVPSGSSPSPRGWWGNLKYQIEEAFKKKANLLPPARTIKKDRDR